MDDTHHIRSAWEENDQETSLERSCVQESQNKSIDRPSERVDDVVKCLAKFASPEDQKVLSGIQEQASNGSLDLSPQGIQLLTVATNVLRSPNADAENQHGGDPRATEEELEEERRKTARLEFELENARKKLAANERLYRQTEEQWRSKCSDLNNQVRVLQSRLNQEETKTAKLQNKLQEKTESRKVKEKRDDALNQLHALNFVGGEHTIQKRKNDSLHRDLATMQQKHEALQASASKLVEVFYRNMEGCWEDTQLYKTVQELQSLDVSPQRVDILSEHVKDFLRNSTESVASSRRQGYGATQKRRCSVFSDKENDNLVTKRSKIRGTRSTTKLRDRCGQPLRGHSTEDSMKASKGGVSFTVEL
eukprot:gb/GECG01005286.1/.p1 GENE.gb/GECG01005286.1/~~gb/GECG01005286.1/.p1  ORF type:complete len:364 (+),score=63.62 gb/GECG01005286.1/:1-1092(+)